MKTIDIEPDIELTPEEIRRRMKMPESFALFRDIGDPSINHLLTKTWTLDPVFRTRDSSIREESNADHLIEMLKSREDLKGDWHITGCSHSLVGWVDHLSFRMLEEAGTTKLTRMAKVYLAWERRAKEGCIDEDDVNRREEESALKSIEDEGRRYVASDAGKDWPQQVMDWLHEHDNGALSNESGDGASIGTAILLPAMLELGILGLHHKSEFLLMQINAMSVFMEWGAQTTQTLCLELAKMNRGSNPHIDAVSAALKQLQRIGLADVIRNDPKILERLKTKWKEGAYGDIWCRR